MKNVTLCIDGKSVSVPAGTTILAASKAAGIRIPTLCAYEGMAPHASCRLCIVQIKGEEKEKLACAVKAAEGMEVITDSAALFAQRKATLTEMFRQHTVDCHHCARVGGSRMEDLEPEICENCFYCDCQREGFCELQALAREFGISALPFEIHEYDFPVDASTEVIIRDPNKCVKCRRCVDVCKNTQAVGVLGPVKTENGQTVGVTTAASLAESACIRCGRCVDVCPTGAVYLKEHKDELPYYAHRRGTKTAALVDESVLPELSRLYGGGITLGQLCAALRKIGVDAVFDAAELTPLLAAEAADMLSKREGGTALLALDSAAKAFLRQTCGDRSADFLFVESAQLRFAALTAGRYDKVFRISGHNAWAEEVKTSGCADVFYNARELFRICKRTGANPTRLAEAPLDRLGVEASDTPYDVLLRDDRWQLGGKAEAVSVSAGEKMLHALICRNPAQLKAALDAGADVIKLNA